MINSTAKRCMEKIFLLHGCEMHTTYTSSKGDEEGVRSLGINLTTDSELTSGIYLKS